MCARSWPMSPPAGRRPTGASQPPRWGWPLERMAVLDRLTLRLAVAELLDPAGPPTAVVIDEAVELVKVYSTDESGAFVNGILSTIAADVRPSPRSECSSDRQVGPVRPVRTGGAWPNASASHTRPLGGRFVPTARSWAPPTSTGPGAHGPRGGRAQRRARRHHPGRPADRRGSVRPADRRGPVPRPRRSRPAGWPLDVAFYRDDIGLRPVLPEAATEIPLDLTGTTVIVVDDVLFTGQHLCGPRCTPCRDFGRARSRAAGRHGRPGPPRAADPPRLRRQEPADPRATRWWT